jgi:hypothetical protein
MGAAQHLNQRGSPLAQGDVLPLRHDMVCGKFCQCGCAKGLI